MRYEIKECAFFALGFGKLQVAYIDFLKAELRMNSGYKLRRVERADNEIVYADVVALFYDIVRVVVDNHNYRKAENASFFPYFGAEPENLLA